MKKELAQYFTVKVWKTNHINDFIDKFKHLGVLDPFAGNGDLINKNNKRRRRLDFHTARKIINNALGG
jgi:hypothetical protein